MAEIVKRSNHLRKDIKKAYLKLLIASLSIILSVLIIEQSYYITIVIIGMMIVWIMFVLNNIEILRFGLQGEKEAFDLLSKLPRQYKILSDVHLVDGTKSSQIDFVIIGPNGLFIMESKHIKGIINGKEDDNYLQKVKIGKGGDKYYKKMFNPIKQISGHKIGMDVFLKKKGFRYRAIPVLYFSNECVVNVQSKSVKIINEPVLVIDFIKRHTEENVYLPEDIQDAIAYELKALDD
jgi:hypothetical protein